MKFSELAARRRSCRKFEARPVARETIDLLLADAFTAPSSKNTRTTHFAVVTDQRVLEKLSAMRDFGSLFVKDAPAVIAVMGETDKTDLWRENCAISATLLQLSAVDNDLGSCWVHVHGRPRKVDEPDGPGAEEYVKGLLGTPADLGILCLVALGYPAEPARPHKERDDSDKVNYL